VDEGNHRFGRSISANRRHADSLRGHHRDSSSHPWRPSAPLDNLWQGPAPLASDLDHRHRGPHHGRVVSSRLGSLPSQRHHRSHWNVRRAPVGCCGSGSEPDSRALDARTRHLFGDSAGTRRTPSAAEIAILTAGALTPSPGRGVRLVEGHPLLEDLGSSAGRSLLSWEPGAGRSRPPLKHTLPAANDN